MEVAWLGVLIVLALAQPSIALGEGMCRARADGRVPMGFDAVIDPATGALVAQGLPDLAESAVSSGLEDAVPTPLAGGGYRVDTRARFLHFVAASVTTDGSVRAACGGGARGEVGAVQRFSTGGDASMCYSLDARY